MNADDMATLAMVRCNHRMEALRICAQRMPRATVQELLHEAERVLKWAESDSASTTTHQNRSGVN